MNFNYNEDEMRYEIEVDDVIYCTVDGKKEELAEVKDLLISAYPTFGELDNKARKCAADELLNTKNDSWLEEGEDPLNAEEFMERLILTKVEVDHDGSVIFWYEDDDMFWGHYVSVFCKDGEAKFAEMQG